MLNRVQKVIQYQNWISEYLKVAINLKNIQFLQVIGRKYNTIYFKINH